MSRCPSDARGPRRADPAKSLLVLLTVLALPATVSAAAAQEPAPEDSVPQAPTDEDVVRNEAGHPVMVDSALSRPNVVSPSHGPPGTEVRVEVSRLPAITPLWLGIGATRSGFEALSLVQSDRYGELEETVEIPEWAGSERSHAFIVFDTQFRPLAVTREFHVTEPDGLVSRAGRIESIGDVCATLRGEDQLEYSLVGRIDALEVDDEVTVEGTLAPDVSAGCADGAIIDVTRVTSGGGPPAGP